MIQNKIHPDGLDEMMSNEHFKQCMRKKKKKGRMNYNKGRGANNQDLMPYNRQQKGKTNLNVYFRRGQNNYKEHSIHQELMKILGNL